MVNESDFKANTVASLLILTEYPGINLKVKAIIKVVTEIKKIAPMAHYKTFIKFNFKENISSSILIQNNQTIF
jgi:hypothetical protein